MSPQHQPAEQPETRPSAYRSSEQRIVTLIALLLLLYVGAEASFGGWIYTYAVALELSDAATAAYLTSAFWGALTLGRLLSIPLAARFRPRSILVADLAGCLTSVGILLLWPGSTAATWLGSLGLGLALAERQIPITGQVTSWFLVASSAGAMTLPWLIGQLFESAGPQITLVAIFLDLVAATFVLAALLRAEPRPDASILVQR
jgi:fucose permease